jgi:BMFP domain-containing protein YqiC
MNLDVIKKKLEALNKASNTSSNDGKSLFWKPTIGKQAIRIVPSKHNPDFPFTEMMFYYEIGNKTIPSPANWGEKDPIMEFAKQLRKSSDKENWRLAKKLDPKVRIFVPVLVRGEESEGVKLWQFGKETYQEFLNLASDEEIGDYTDVYEGRDIKLNTVGPEVTGTKYNKTTISPSLKSSPLADSETAVKSYLENQVNPLEVFKKYSFDEIKQMLQEWLTPEESNEEESIESEVEIKSAPTFKSNYSLEGGKKTPEDKFNDMFGDSDESDDLPF